jgi:hypothetical protein
MTVALVVLVVAVWICLAVWFWKGIADACIPPERCEGCDCYGCESGCDLCNGCHRCK